MKRLFRALAAWASITVTASLLLTSIACAENIKIALIDPLSGSFAPVGQNLLRTWQFMAERSTREKWAGNNTIEVTGFDNKGSPQESLTILKSVIDQGYRYVAQGGGSGVALALVDAVNKHNERNPGKEVVFLNYAAIDPDLTNSKCSFWHFRFDANSDMKMEALTTFMAKDKDIKNVYIIGQNYTFGHQFTRAAKEYLARKRPDIKIVGDDLHPLGQVKDFAPYVAKIKASGADTVLTGNWGTDLSLLVKAAREAGLNVDFYTYYAGSAGVPTAMGAAGADRVKMINTWHHNTKNPLNQEILAGFKKKYSDDFSVSPIHAAMLTFSKAVKASHSTDPVNVAMSMEGMSIAHLNGTAEMRKTDHQLLQPLYIATWTKVDGKEVKNDLERTGYGWKTEQKIEAYVASQPTSCQMKRPNR